MKVMLDINICIYIIKQPPQPVLDRFAAYRVGDVVISVITLAELEYGVRKSSNSAQNREALRGFISSLALIDVPQSSTARRERGQDRLTTMQCKAANRNKLSKESRSDPKRSHLLVGRGQHGSQLILHRAVSE